jgi:threonine/homoserine/homoserine lactone efflux protein
MELTTLLLFSATVVPLICTPGLDMMFISSQALSAGLGGGLRATLGVCLGYLVHSTLVALGLAAVIATSPLVFEAIRWAGIAYLVYIAFKLLRSATKASAEAVEVAAVSGQLQKGFITSVLNPKGAMIYIAILPQFMTGKGNATLQAAILSLTFIVWCGILYTALTVALAKLGSSAGFTDRRRRIVDGVAGVMVLGAAAFMVVA